jgi:hypothetical protein
MKARRLVLSKFVLFKYLHRVARKLVQNNGILGLVKGTGDVLNEETESLLFLLCCHLMP